MSGEDPEYQRVHWVVYRARGTAKEYDCIQCGNPAEQWAYQHSASEDDEKVSREGHLYSENPRDYEPMCRSCHRFLDLSMMSEEQAKNLLLAQIEGGARAGCSQLRRCDVCGLVSHAPGIGKHQKARGHNGWTSVDRGEA